jgi:hypothetical protein
VLQRPLPARIWLAVVLAALHLLGLVSPGVARAEEERGRSKLSLDLDLAFAQRPDRGDTGRGFALRFGNELDGVILSFTPEVVASYHGFSGSLQPSAVRGLVGGRLSFGKILEPGVYAHVGAGRLSYPDATSPAFAGGAIWGLAWDAGGTLDLTVLPLVDLGVHAGYARVDGTDVAPTLGWVNVGVHGALVF